MAPRGHVLEQNYFDTSLLVITVHFMYCGLLYWGHVNTPTHSFIPSLWSRNFVGLNLTVTQMRNCRRLCRAMGKLHRQALWREVRVEIYGCKQSRIHSTGQVDSLATILDPQKIPLALLFWRVVKWGMDKAISNERWRTQAVVCKLH